MQIPLTWLNELVEIKAIKLNELVKKLTLGGFEVEEVLKLEIDNQKQIILDISATANRSDSLSIQGISNEISTLLNEPLRIGKYSKKTLIWKQKIETKIIKLKIEQNCSMLVSVSINNLINLDSPLWMKKKLRNSGISPTNDLFDFEKYILVETGYPFQFYDFEKLCSKLNTSNFDLSITSELQNENFLASNNNNYRIDDSTLMITANQIPISIAGIIEAKDFLISKSTKSILIEGSIFKASKIRQQSRQLGLRTERSSRYEKSLQNTYLLESLYKLIYLLKISNPNLTCSFNNIKKVDEKPIQPLKLRYKIINEILGPTNNSNFNNGYLTPKQISQYLNRLKFKFIYNKLNLFWLVQIPSFRSDDITREIDLIEEIGRLYGFNNFLTVLPQVKMIGNEDSNYKIRKKMIGCLINLGFTELINYSLVNKEILIDHKVKLINPISTDYSNLRASLLPNLIKTVQENFNQTNFPIEGFEYGHVFDLNSSNTRIEKEHIAGVFGEIKTKEVRSNKNVFLNWFEAKGKIEQLFQQLNVPISWQKYSTKKVKNLFHPYKSAKLFLQAGIELGFFGQINPILANQLKISHELYLFEFDIESVKLQIQSNKLKLYQPYSLYPKVLKDLSFIVKEEIDFEKMEQTLYYNGTEFLSQINLIDKYTGSSIPNKHISLCFQFIFQSNKETLKTKQIENIMNKLQLILIQQFNAIIRD